MKVNLVTASFFRHRPKHLKVVVHMCATFGVKTETHSFRYKHKDMWTMDMYWLEFECPPKDTHAITKQISVD